MASVAEVLVQTLALSGVKRIYGLPGDSLNGVTDAIRRHPELQWIHVRHEEAAAFAAGTDAHLTNWLAVCAGSCGPGNLHFINGLYDCHRSRVPVLAIASQIPSQELGTTYFQETSPEQVFKDCSQETVAALLPRLKKKDGDHLKHSLKHYRDSRKDLNELATGKPGSSPLHPEYVARVIDETAADDAILTVDIGTPAIWAARYLHFNGKRRLVGSWSHGSMAGALPEALGRRLRFQPGRSSRFLETVNLRWAWESCSRPCRTGCRSRL